MDREHLDARARKIRSHQVLANFRLPVLEGLPCFAPISAVRVPPQEQVVLRAAAAACLSYRTQLGSGYLRDLDEFMLSAGVFPVLTAVEKQFYFSPGIEEEPLLAFFSWSIESCHALFWALGHLDGLAYPDAATHTDRLFHLFFAGELDEFRQKSKLRSAAAILDAADLYYRYRAICQRAAEQGEIPPGMLDPTIVQVRYAALLWLVGRGKWEEVQSLA
ncbi:MAG: DUF4272 domain-containing protein [Verrucomicrobia bacterium]|nr:DUF4272 domain-containing protein [Verrucomicrobiota bacterium]